MPTAKSKSHPGKKHAPHTGTWARAFRDTRVLLAMGLCYIVAVTAEAVHCGVPPAQFARVGWAMLIVFVKLSVLLLALGSWAFWRELPHHRGRHRWRSSFAATLRTATRFLHGEVFAYGCAGALVLWANCFFFIQKSLIRIVNPYHWDPFLASADRIIHLGHYPHEWVIPVSDFLGLSHIYDVAYYLWFVMMYLLLSYGLFIDTNLKRRLRMLAVFFLAWVLLGSAAATLLSSVGPLFYHDFYPGRPDPYAGLLEHFIAQGPGGFPIAYFSRMKLIEWTHSADLINANALSAMPSLHIAVCWVAVLYARALSRAWFAAALAFTALIFFGTIYFGFHFAADGYMSVAVVSLLWFAAGRLLDRAYPDTPHLKRF